MAAVATRAQVFEIQPQVRPLRDGNLMIGVQVAVAPIVSIAKLGQHSIRGRIAKLETAKVRDNRWFPFAVDTSPTIPLEA